MIYKLFNVEITDLEFKVLDLISHLNHEEIQELEITTDIKIALSSLTVKGLSDEPRYAWHCSGSRLVFNPLTHSGMQFCDEWRKLEAERINKELSQQKREAALIDRQEKFQKELAEQRENFDRELAKQRENFDRTISEQRKEFDSKLARKSNITLVLASGLALVFDLIIELLRRFFF